MTTKNEMLNMLDMVILPNLPPNAGAHDFKNALMSCDADNRTIMKQVIEFSTGLDQDARAEVADKVTEMAQELKGFCGSARANTSYGKYCDIVEQAAELKNMSSPRPNH